MIKLYPSEKFSLRTDLRRAEIVERLEYAVIVNHHAAFLNRYNTKHPEKLFEGIVYSTGFRISKAKVYGNISAWHPQIDGIISDNQIEIELKFPTLSTIIITSFLLFGIIGIINSIYSLVIKD